MIIRLIEMLLMLGVILERNNPSDVGGNEDVRMEWCIGDCQNRNIIVGPSVRRSAELLHWTKSKSEAITP